jgi:ring-1,2-phenylacetyl-CoA epoxidase subunit PaaD
VMDVASVWSVLENIHDPEIPVISVVELGVIQGVEVEADRVRIGLTPTFAGCPALHVMKREIKERLSAAGAEAVEVDVLMDPPWTTDRISPTGREKLRRFGLAPAPIHAGRVEVVLLEPTTCPYCGSQDTEMKNGFGPTACRAIHFCNHCRQPFEAFKPV